MPDSKVVFVSRPRAVGWSFNSRENMDKRSEKVMFQVVDNPDGKSMVLMDPEMLSIRDLWVLCLTLGEIVDKRPKVSTDPSEVEPILKKLNAMRKAMDDHCRKTTGAPARFKPIQTDSLMPYPEESRLEIEKVANIIIFRIDGEQERFELTEQEFLCYVPKEMDGRLKNRGSFPFYEGVSPSEIYDLFKRVRTVHFGAVSILVNGMSVSAQGGQEITREEIIRLAYPNIEGPVPVMSVIYQNASGPKDSGIMSVDTRVRIKAGTRFTAMDTSNA